MSTAWVSVSLLQHLLVFGSSAWKQPKTHNDKHGQQEQAETNNPFKHVWHDVVIHLPLHSSWIGFASFRLVQKHTHTWTPVYDKCINITVDSSRLCTYNYLCWSCFRERSCLTAHAALCPVLLVRFSPRGDFVLTGSLFPPSRSLPASIHLGGLCFPIAATYTSGRLK